MRAIRFLLLVAVVAAPASVRADGLIHKLPADGTGVTYEMEYTMTRGAGMEYKMTGTLSLAAVGTKKVKGTVCRWIEFTMNMKRGEREQKVVAKILVPESELGKGKSPLSNIKAGWLSQEGQDVEEVLDAYSAQGGPLPAFLPKPLKNVKLAKPAAITTGIGKLSARKLIGNTKYEQTTGNRKKKYAVDYELQLADKTPFGVASAKIAMKRNLNPGTPGGETNTISLKLKSINKNVKSGLPDKN